MSVAAAAQSPISIWLRPRRYRISGMSRSTAVEAAWQRFAGSRGIGASRRITSA